MAYRKTQDIIDQSDELAKRFEDHEPASRPCECHKPTHEARQPHPSTQIGRQ